VFVPKTFKIPIELVNPDIKSSTPTVWNVVGAEPTSMKTITDDLKVWGGCEPYMHDFLKTSEHVIKKPNRKEKNLFLVN
jgi:hypothetical protein